jgi:hypothetical protein
MNIVSCGSVSKVVYQTNTADSKVRYFVAENPNYKKGEGKFYARVDSNSVRIFYTFQQGNIYKIYDNQKNYVYALVSHRPMLRLTKVDSVVLAKADSLMDSFGYKDLKRAKGAMALQLRFQDTD